MQRSSLLSSRVLALGLAISLAACGGSTDEPGGTGGSGGSGATGGVGGTGGAGGAGGTGGTEECTQPVIERLEPATGNVGTNVKVYGRCFAPTAAKNKVQFNGTASTAFGVSADGTRLDTSVPAGATTGPIFVFSDYGSGYVRTDGPTFTISDSKPVPTLNSVAPDHVTRGAGSTLLTLSGTGFFLDSRVVMDGEEVNSNYTSPTSMQVNVPATAFATVRTISFQVVNDPPGGGSSNAATFKVVAPINLVGAVAYAVNKVAVTFDQPVAGGVATDRRAWRVASGASTLSVTKAERSQSNNRVIHLTTSNQTPNYNYTVTVSDQVQSSQGGAIEQTQTSFRAFGSDPELVASYGADGCGAQGLSTPFGLTAANGKLYATEYTGQQVQIVDESGSFGGFLGNDGATMGLHTSDTASGLGCPSTGSTNANAFRFPRGAVAVAGNGELFVADTGNNRVFRFAASGALGTNLSGGTTWSSPVVLGFLDDRVWVANGDDKIYRVPTTGFSDPALFGPGTSAGAFAFGVGDGHVPAMAADAGRGILYITDPVNHRVQKFLDLSPRGWIGKGHNAFVTGAVDCLAQGTCAGTANGEFTFPRGVALDSSDAIWVIDEANGGRIQKFNDNGDHLRSTDLGFLPGGVAIDSEGFLWIADQDTNQLHKYRI
ncbi:IPT/TIG domain-containing protein [Vulgatibacter sp.]|uniref:IPT/TIG domain-containing protein n=1 Tax=Vulgatibacter sp. TaxID=1971226 RepID=UPI00356829D3